MKHSECMNDVFQAFRIGWRALLLTSILLILMAKGPLGAQAPGPFAGAEYQAAGRYLAGVEPVGAAGWEALDREPACHAHRQAMQARWQGALARRLEAMAWFSALELGDLRNARCLFYPFGGPDLIHARVLFPGAGVYVLCGLEPVGSLKNLRSLTAAGRAEALAQMRRTLASSMNQSFFITKDLSTDLRGRALEGVLPVLVAEAALLGDEVRRMEGLTLDPTGRPVVEERHPTGVRLVLGRPGEARERTVYYWQQDCADRGLEGRPFLEFLHRQGPTSTYLKSASYLLHHSTFSTLRAHILATSSGVLQDDSGLPHRCFVERNWTLKAYGTYRKPIPVFNWCAQKDLAEVFRGETRPLNFCTGYGRESHLVCYRPPVTP